jgi:hypothetical protein
MEAKLGDYVTTNRHNHEGRVYAKHHSFKDTNESDAWFNIQQPPLDKSTKEESWYSILTKNGGAIVVPESDLISTNHPYDLNNIWESFYF